MTGTEAPIAIPRIIGSVTSKVSSPVLDSAWRIPTAALALCRIAVKAAPRRIPSRGLLKLVRKEINPGSSRRPETAPLMVFIGCLLSPVNGYFRYAFPMVLCVPLLFVQTMLPQEEKNEN